MFLWYFLIWIDFLYSLKFIQKFLWSCIIYIFLQFLRNFFYVTKFFFNTLCEWFLFFYNIEKLFFFLSENLMFVFIYFLAYLIVCHGVINLCKHQNIVIKEVMSGRNCSMHYYYYYYHRDFFYIKKKVKEISYVN